VLKVGAENGEPALIRREEKPNS